MNWLLSKKEDGSMKKAENIESFLKKKEIDPDRFVRANLVHGKEIAFVEKGDAGKVIEGVDGLITENPIALGVTVADCLPVYIKSEEMTGILHAGWRSIHKGIIEEATDLLSELEAENVSVFVGPSIKNCHFEVKKDLIDKFSDYPDCFDRREGKIFLDLQKVVEKKLKNNGIKNIRISEKCTFCSDDLFSYRRDKKINNMLAVIKPTR